MDFINVFTIRYIISLVFGTVVTAALAGILNKKNNWRKLFGVFLFILVIELCIIYAVGLDMTLKIYPVHTHLVLMLFLILLFHIRPYDAVIFVLLAYMCCQIPAWISKFIIYAVSGNDMGECILYLMMVVVTAWFICRYVGDSAKEMLGESLESDIVFGIIPITYYLFDYITTVWTNLLYEGNYSVTQFMPFVICIAYIIFLIVLRKEQKQRQEAFEERTMIKNELAIVRNEIEALNEMEQMSRIYRHDMRHHFALILGFIEDEKPSDAVSYINENIREIERITPQKFCDMDTLNLLLSHFAAIAQEQNITYHFDVRLPENIPLSNIEICAMVSNALENAYHEVQKLPDDNRMVDMVFCVHNGLLVFSVDNSCGESSITNGMENKAVEDGDHGFGTRSIAVIAKNHKGTADFTAKDGWFQLMVLIPLDIRS